MYGIVNAAIQDLVIANFGIEKWNLILERSGIQEDFFISSESYDDEITYKLATAASEEMNMHLDDVLIAFGEWWVIKTTKEKYSGLMESGGSNLREFIINLPMFHNRLMLFYPKLSSPEFKITDITNSSVHLHYLSTRQGFKEFVRGLIQGLAILFETQVVIELIQSREEGFTHEIFKIISI